MSKSIPKYRKQKRPDGYDAFVELNGQRFYLGKYNSRASRKKYHQLLAEWSQAGNVLTVNKDEITVIELIDRFWIHANNHYRKPDGTPTSELGNIKLALKPLKKLYGMLPASDIGPILQARFLIHQSTSSPGIAVLVKPVLWVIFPVFVR